VFDDLKNRRYAEIARLFKDDEQILAKMREVTIEMEKLKQANISLMYARQVLKNGFAVGDTITHKDYKELHLVKEWRDGIFVAAPIAGRSKKAIAVYSGWKRVVK
jgi:hypothetical protein